MKKEEEPLKQKILQIGYEQERDRLTWDGWDIHCGQGLDVLLPDQLGNWISSEKSICGNGCCVET